MPDELFTAEPAMLSVGELTRQVRDLLEAGIGDVWVEGEISNHRKQASGHQYFTLKDDHAQLACVLFSRTGSRQKLADGMCVQLRGTITVYETRGQYQMIVQMVQPRGQGALQVKFEALKRKLDGEGLFDAKLKLRLPEFPRTVGLVTSPTGAALQDMLNVLDRRAPWLRLVLIPVRVQGEGAAGEIAGAIRQFNSDYQGKIDLLVIARGGGSIEDLWAFNEEVVARAIHESRIPIVSAVGHEIDFTIADFVADLRAPTPSAAAELIVPDAGEIVRRLQVLETRIRQSLQSSITHGNEILLRRLAPSLAREMRRVIEQREQSLDLLAVDLQHFLEIRKNESQHRLIAAIASLQQHRPNHLLALKKQNFRQTREQFTSVFARLFAEQKTQLDRMQNMLRVLGPEATLKRGYTITTRADGSILRGAAEVKHGEIIYSRWTDGEIASTVK